MAYSMHIGIVPRYSGLSGGKNEKECLLERRRLSGQSERDFSSAISHAFLSGMHNDIARTLLRLGLLH